MKINIIEDKKINALKIYMRLLKAVKPYTMAIVLSVFGLAILAFVDGYLFKTLIPNIVDKGFVEKNPEFFVRAPIYILSLFLIRGFSTFLTTYCMGYVGRNTVKDFRCKMLKHIMHLPVSFFQANSAGELLSKINYDAEQVSESISGAISDTVRGLFILISMVVVMFLISWRISLLVLVVGPILGVYFRYVSSKMRIHSIRVQKTMGDVTQVAGEIINGYQVIKGYGGVEYENNRTEVVTKNNTKQEMRMFFATASSIPLMQFIGASALALLVYLATMPSINLSAGEFTGIFGAMLGLLRPIKQVAAVNSVLQRGIAAASSIFALLDQKPEEDFGQIAIKRVQGSIVFKNVYFNYQSRSKLKASQAKVAPTRAKDASNIHNGSVDDIENVLTNINFTIKPGEVVALVGSSGSGKSTIASLLPRFYNIASGEILLDGIDIKNYKLQDLREQIALVTQDVILFNDTIANNIAYGCIEKFTQEQILAAAKAAHVSEFALKLRDGLDTVIGDRGILLSGGQKQRIAIARAILKNAPILILDEATSALDTESERYIQQALSHVVKNRTTIVIAHRLSTIENADQILVLENGAIVESGAHLELIKKNSRYRELHSMQFSAVVV